MKKCVLTDKFDVTLTRDELMTVLRLVRREVQEIPPQCNYDTSVWESRKNRLKSIENKVVESYNISGVEYVEEDELEDGDFVAELPDENGESTDD